MLNTEIESANWVNSYLGLYFLKHRQFRWTNLRGHIANLVVPTPYNSLASCTAAPSWTALGQLLNGLH